MCSATERTRPASASGFTLFEVAIAGGILAILVLGLTALWSSVGHVTTDLLLRQKAIFVLNGEMERLSALYQRTDFGQSGPAASNGYDPIPGEIGTPGSRFIYPASVAAYVSGAKNDFVTTKPGDFRTGAESLVYIDGGLANLKRAYVWVDRSRGIAARMSWSTTALTPDSCSFTSCACVGFSGSGTGDCLIVELILDYPYRLDEAGTAIAGEALQSLTLKTILGRR